MSNNTTFNKTFDDSELKTYGRTVAIFTWIYCIPGAVVLLLAIRANLQIMKTEAMPFRVLVTNTMAADFTLLILFIFYAAPCDLLLTEVYGHTGSILAGTYQAYAFITSMFTSFVISSNRFVAIFFPQSLDRYFSLKRTYVIAAMTWLAAVFYALFDVYMTGCDYIYDERKFIFSIYCPDQGDHFFVTSKAILGLYGIGFMYGLALIKLKRDNAKISSEEIAQNMAKRRMRVFWQAFGIWASILANVLAYHFISPYMTHVLLNGIVSVVLILCPPYGTCLIVLIFDGKTRKHIASFSDVQ
uniref:G-protein coupled receptors family 1 profile domain-containing protein n=1 Tax=Romanomermis culicivorax TaxID=13658 RepID=A0A915IMV6_ROMCU